MNELVTIMKNQAVTSSLKVAEYFGKRHDTVLRAVENAVSNLRNFADVENGLFKTTYIDEKGENRPMYLMNRDVFTFVVMGFTGKKAAEWKWKYIQAFNKMEKILQERATLDWQETRRLGKLTRRSETDIIADLIEYAKTQGSKHADRLYQVYSKLANKIVGLKGGERDNATIKQLNTLDDVESMIFHVIKLGMAQCKHYKEIYQDCKRRLDWFLEITFGTEKLVA